MTLDATLRPVARQLINQFGKTVTLSKVTQGTYDPVSGTYSSGCTTDHTVKVSPPESYDQADIDGSLVQRDDFEVQLAALGAPAIPEIGDTITMDGESYSIITAPPVYSGELIAVYKLQCRK